MTKHSRLPRRREKLEWKRQRGGKNSGILDDSIARFAIFTPRPSRLILLPSALLPNGSDLLLDRSELKKQISFLDGCLFLIVSGMKRESQKKKPRQFVCVCVCLSGGVNGGEKKKKNLSLFCCLVKRCLMGLTRCLADDPSVWTGPKL